jgi:hypothetical protein
MLKYHQLTAVSTQKQPKKNGLVLTVYMNGWVVYIHLLWGAAGFARKYRRLFPENSGYAWIVSAADRNRPVKSLLGFMRGFGANGDCRERCPGIVKALPAICV